METMKQGPRISAETFSAKFALAEADESAGTFKGMASVFGAPIDTYPPSIIERGAFTKTLAEQGGRVKILWQHDTWEPIGRPVSLRETEQGLELIGRLDPIPQGERAMTQIKSGTLTDLSIGFDPLKWEYAQGMGDGEPVRMLKEVKLWEISIVTFGAQRAATMGAFAVAFRDLPVIEKVDNWDRTAAAARVHEWAKGDQERLYRAYLAAGKDEASCRFQIADVVDDKLVVVPQAVYAAALEINGATDLPPRVLEYAREHLASYYHKLGRVAPWESERSARLLVEPIASLPADAFEGRVLSTRNKSLVQDAVAALQALLDAASPKVDEADPGTGESIPTSSGAATPEAVITAAATALAPEVVAAVPAPAEAQATATPAETQEKEPAPAAPEPSYEDVELRLKEMELAYVAGSMKAA